MNNIDFSGLKRNEYKRNRILFDFESLVDIKISFLKKALSEISMIPISDFQLSFFKKVRMYQYRDVFDSLDMELNVPDEESLLHPEYPVFTSMKLYLETLLDKGSGYISAVVLCKDNIQQRIINENIPNVSTIVGPRSQVKTINFSRIVLADPRHTLEFRDPITTDFMILNYRTNFSKDNPTLIDPSILIQIADVNTITIAKAYPEIPDPEYKKENENNE